ncbi:hypothetical protein [Veillonella criceti]|uniref:Phage minor structural protein GP20 n=1 Tax=Veillonella criceti TaxID=103891 RepID=A0A380NJY0_9FIRM|nr:hypothetical protein [Veillonella criceti]SUP42258.1 Uncharacterised protein [Veillonella criceti]
MAYQLKEIFAALAATENGAEMVADLQQEIGNLRTESAARRNKEKELLGLLGIDDPAKAPETIKGINETLTALKAAGQKPETMGAQFEALSKQVKELTDKMTQAEEKAKQERDKRIQTTIKSQLISALNEGHAIKPDTFASLLIPNVVVKDDESIAFKQGDSEIDVKDGVNAWLKENLWAVKNTSQPGAGSTSSSNQKKMYSMEDLKNMSPAEINANWETIKKGVTE